MRYSDILTEAERPGWVSRTGQRLISKLPGNFSFINKASGRADAQQRYNQLWKGFTTWMGQADLTFGSLTGADIATRFSDDKMKNAMEEVGVADDATPISKTQAQNLIWTYTLIDFGKRPNLPPPPPLPSSPAPAPPPAKVDLDTISNLSVTQAKRVLYALSKPRSVAITFRDANLNIIVNVMRKYEITRPKIYQKLFKALHVAAGKPIPEGIEAGLREKYQKFLKES